MSFKLNSFGFLILISCLLFVPFIFLGGFGVSDDLSLITQIGPSYLSDLKYSLSRSGHISRPIYGFIQTTLLHCFGPQPIFYNLFRFFLWGLFILLAYRVFHILLGKQNTFLFVFFLLFPIYSSSHLFNSMQNGYILSMIFYLAALRSIQNEKGQFNSKKYLNFFFFSLLALLSCEIVFPLFIFPLIYQIKNDHIKKNNLPLALTIGVIFLIIIILKFFIGALYQNESQIYGFSISMHSLLQLCYYFFAILIEIPLLVLEVIPFFLSEPILLSSLVIIPIFYFNKKGNDLLKDNKLIVCSILTIIACSLIFLLSDYPAVTFGFYNKMLLPSHLFISLLLAFLCSSILNSRYYFLAHLIGILWFGSMELQLVNSIRSWKLRNETYYNIIPGLNNLSSKENYIFVDVPFFLKTNYNNEPVFSLNYDFQGGLILNGYKGDAKKVNLYTTKMIYDSNYWLRHNTLNIISENRIQYFTWIKNIENPQTEFKIYENINRNELFKLENRNFKQECLRSEIRNSLSQLLRSK